MIETVIQRLKHALKIGEVHNPLFAFHQRAGDMHGHAKTVTVQSAALVIGRKVRKAMCCLEREFAKDFHVLACRYGRTSFGPIWYSFGGVAPMRFFTK